MRLWIALAFTATLGCGDSPKGCTSGVAAVDASLRADPRDPDARLRELLAYGPEGVAVVDRLISEFRDDDLSIAAIDALSRVKTDESTAVLIHALSNSSEVRWAARQTLARRGESAASALMCVVRTNHPLASFASAALTDFAVRSPKSLLPFLIESLRHRLWDVRFNALWSLRYYGEVARDALPEIHRLEGDPVPSVANMAREASAAIDD